MLSAPNQTAEVHAETNQAMNRLPVYPIQQDQQLFQPTVVQSQFVADYQNRGSMQRPVYGSQPIYTPQPYEIPPDPLQSQQAPYHDQQHTHQNYNVYPSSGPTMQSIQSMHEQQWRQQQQAGVTQNLLHQARKHSLQFTPQLTALQPVFSVRDLLRRAQSQGINNKISYELNDEVKRRKR
jgi:hypothetical protein